MLLSHTYVCCPTGQLHTFHCVKMTNAFMCCKSTSKLYMLESRCNNNIVYVRVLHALFSLPTYACSVSRSIALAAYIVRALCALAAYTRGCFAGGMGHDLQCHDYC